MRRHEPPRPVQTSLPEVVTCVSQATGVSLTRLRSAGRHRVAAQARALVAYLARDVGGIPITATAQYFRRDQVTLSLGIHKLHERQASDPRLDALVQRLADALRSGSRPKYKITNV